MRKKPVFLIFSVLLSLSSCSELILPKNVEIQGTLDLPIRIGTSNWGSALTKTIEEAFTGNSTFEGVDFDIAVYDVDYGQSEQAFLIYIHSEMSYPLNPGDHLDNVAKYLLSSGEPYEISHELDMTHLNEVGLAPVIISIPFSNIPVIANRPAGLVSTLPIPVNKTISLEDYLKNNDDFIHAVIFEGELTIEVRLLQGSNALDSNAIDISNISIKQDIFAENYQGLFCSPGALENQHFNRNDISINGNIFLDTAIEFPSSEDLTVELTIKLVIGKLKAVDLHFTEEIRKNLNHQIDPIALGPVADYVNYIMYNECNEEADTDPATGLPTTGIGIQFNFDEMVNGLKMTLECEALNISKTEELRKGEDIIFGNKSAGTLWLDGGRPESPFGDKVLDQLEFKLDLRPSGDDESILSIDFGGDGMPPEKINIEGTARFFQNWTKAQINMASIMKVSPNTEDAFRGQMPEQGEDPIDLSLLANYVPGFTFDENSIQSKIYLNGPNKAFEAENPELLFRAEYGENDSDEIYHDLIALDENAASINDDDLSNGSYNKKLLPAGGNEFNFLKIINSHPDNLVFTYEIELPSVLTVSPEMFRGMLDDPNESSIIIDSNITVTIMLMLSLKLNGPGTIPVDMFEGEDLFGRESPGPLIDAVDIHRLKVTVDFLGEIFKGGRLYMEKFDDAEENYKDRMLFPEGIELNGNRIILNVPYNKIKMMEKNLIPPDVRVEFGDNSSISIPRKMGMAGIKFEVKGGVNVGEFLE